MRMIASVLHKLLSAVGRGQAGFTGSFHCSRFLRNSSRCFCCSPLYLQEKFRRKLLQTAYQNLSKMTDSSDEILAPLQAAVKEQVK